MNLQNVTYGVYVVRNKCTKRMRFAGQLFAFGGLVECTQIQEKWVITELNGTKITSVSEFMDIYDELTTTANAQSVSCKAIDTNGRTQTINFNVVKIEDLVITQGR
jgi:hypothetical protein